MSLVVIGTVAFDAIETPFGKTDKIVGGAATFISIAASYFNKSNKLISVVGDDYDMEMLERLKKKGIDLEGLQIKKGEKSERVKQLQKDLGLTADGKLGPGTEKALKAKGYSVPLTQSDYDKIMANCEGTTLTTTIKSIPSDYDNSFGV